MPHWQESHRADPRALPIADRHYNRQKIGSSQFVPPGRCFVLLIPDKALWVTSWPFARYTKHAWAGAWMNSCFRNEQYQHARSSELIVEAVARTRGFAMTEPSWACEPPPPLGMVTFVDPEYVRHKRDFGRCYRKAGFVHVGFTKGGLYALQLTPDKMPPPLLEVT